MVFSSLIFLTVFLPLFLAVYYIVPFKRKSLIILLGSQVFYCWWRIDFMLLLDAITLINYLISLKMVRTDDRKREKKWLVFGLVVNLLSLGYYKYFNFGMDSMNALLTEAGMTPMIFLKVILPVGISFHIFQSISYLVDIYRRDAKVADSFLEFCAFSTLFPQLIAGPVIRYKDVAEQFHHREHTLSTFHEGALRFMIGFIKKVLIADTVAPLADMAFSQPNPSMADAWLGILAYTIQLYFDFSGYSHMAIGLGLMMGFRFIENFNHPYISRSITEFWRRWHMSLSTWLRDYLYIPLGGNKKGKVRTYINLLLTMMLGGLWHGANWTFVLWGSWHGAWLALERLIGGKKKGSPYPAAIALPFTLLLVMMGWVLFRAPNLSTAFGMYGGMLGMHGAALSDTLAWQITPLHLSFLGIALAAIFLIPRYFAAKSAPEAGKTWAGSLRAGEQIIVIALFALSFCKLIAQSHSPFLYFQF